MISNHLVNLLGAKDGIKVVSVYGQGTEFSFEIPFSYINPSCEDLVVQLTDKSPRPSLLSEPCLCRRILSVDDNDYNHMVVERILKKLGFEVVKAFNGVDALKVLQDSTSFNSYACGDRKCSFFSLILTDLQMPIMDGLDLIRAVRALPGNFGKIPIILVSATDDKVQIDQGFEAGMNDFLPKPLTEEILKKSLKRLVSPEFEGMDSKALA
eukprot:TRINITY_DN5755_c0_g2_i1.p1 TRINITY_DN5755_c0_g2~~TRINITY_DN5755_c0_g2_i1.p1  ORF type:complete len:211 (-),score=27.99 TRINITY_DN5755_c0_g2_i1:47-679(-)